MRAYTETFDEEWQLEALDSDSDDDKPLASKLPPKKPAAKETPKQKPSAAKKPEKRKAESEPESESDSEDEMQALIRRAADILYPEKKRAKGESRPETVVSTIIEPVSVPSQITAQQREDKGVGAAAALSDVTGTPTAAGSASHQSIAPRKQYTTLPKIPRHTGPTTEAVQGDMEVQSLDERGGAGVPVPDEGRKEEKLTEKNIESRS